MEGWGIICVVKAFPLWTHYIQQRFVSSNNISNQRWSCCNHCHHHADRSQVSHRFLYKCQMGAWFSVLFIHMICCLLQMHDLYLWLWWSCWIRSYNSLQNDVTWVGVPTKPPIFCGRPCVFPEEHILPSNSCNWSSCVSNFARKPVISYKWWDIRPINRKCVSTGMEHFLKWDISSIFRILEASTGDFS